MDATHIHLLTNHIPILGSIFGIFLLIIGLALKNRTIEMTALATLIAVTIFTFPAYLSGDEAEHAVEHLAGASEWELEEHEEHAELSLWLMIITGIFSLAAILSYRFMESFTKWLRIGTVFIGLFAFVSMIPLALHGGKIMHSELRGDTQEEDDHESHEDHEEREEHSEYEDD
ncbi:hypothetical protein N8004_01125 [Salibacteraceae bacterium]|jgi:hypothetical protein|nr:hypothetical protein [Flavobacteriales bacterium]MDC1202558.1 hypothetical protein [Salibacteraceae bacterium]HAW21450.1 hypothetical protein [Flavobacteriales bacterium]